MVTSEKKRPGGVPPVTSAATGTAVVTLNTTTMVVAVTGTFTGLSGPATGAHIHGPAGANATGPVVITLTAGAAAAGMLSGTGTLTAAQMTDMTGGLTYVNVHTAANMGGEIRGQIVLP